MIYHVNPPGWEELTSDQRRDRQAVLISVNDGHAFFYKCPDARKSIQHMKIDYEPAYGKHAKLVHHGDDDDGGRLLYSAMEPFSVDALDATRSAKQKATFHHTNPTELAE